MADTLTIPKLPNSSFPEYLNFAELRAIGIQHIEELGSDLWTDFNVHDPGITILEVLCYAITDLGYRNNFDIKDLLTRSSEEKNEVPNTIFKRPFDDNFFTAAEILSCNPVTITDLRKLLIDVPGVKNAWLERADGGEIPIYLNNRFRPQGAFRNRSVLQYDQPIGITEGSNLLKIKGLYNVCIEFEKNFELDACGNREDNRSQVLKEVNAVLNAHRNLCEDYKTLTFFDEEEIAVCADIELAPNADPNEVLLGINKKVEEYLSPTLNFYTLQELLSKKVPIETIFEGRPLTADSHGFIDSDELKKLDPRSEIYASDILQEIMDVDGIVALKNLALVNYIDDLPRTKGEKWCLKLNTKYRPHFSLWKSKINFFKDVLPVNTNKELVAQRYQEEKAASNKAYLDPEFLDLAIPEGTHLDLKDYTSIQNDFPLTYGIGEEGIKGIPTAKRQAQAKQLKAFLLFFDQILVNYLAQLSHIRDLFSLNVDEGQFIPGKGTYFTQLLREAPGINALIKNYHEGECPNANPSSEEDYEVFLNSIVESSQTYYDRRNRFLDHLLARFAESFTEYVLLNFEESGSKRNEAQIIQDKTDFLKNYPDISRNRGRAFNYLEPVVSSDKENIAGLKKRVSKLLGINDVNRHTLGIAEIFEREAGWEFIINDNSGTPLLKSLSLFPDSESVTEAYERAKQLICQEDYFRRLTCELSNEVVYSFYIVNDQAKVLASIPSSLQFKTIEELIEFQEELIQSIQDGVLEFTIEREVVEQGLIAFFVLKNIDGEIILLSEDRIPDFDGDEDVDEEIIADLEALILEIKTIVNQDKDLALNYFCKTRLEVTTLEKYRYLLVDENNSYLAESVSSYSSSNDRDAAIQSLISQCLLRSVECQIIQENECFYYVLLDYSRQVELFRSNQGYSSALEALRAFGEEEEESTGSFLQLAVNRDNYCKFEKRG